MKKAPGKGLQQFQFKGFKKIQKYINLYLFESQ